MTEYRAFDKSGAIVRQDDVIDTDDALAWGFGIALDGAVLIERKDGEHWVCFQEFRTMRAREGRTRG